MKLIFHIGTHKTGTTAIQEWLLLNREALSRRQVYLPRQTLPLPHHQIPAFFSQQINAWHRSHGIETEAEKRQYFGGQFEKKLREELEMAGQSYDATVVTSENLSVLASVEELQEMREFFAEMCDSIEVILYVRNQVAKSLALYSDAVSRGKTTLQPDDYVARILSDPIKSDYLSLIARWQQVFGPESIRVHSYESVLNKYADVRKHFSKFLSEGPSGPFMYPPHRANGSFSAAELSALRALNLKLVESGITGQLWDHLWARGKLELTGFSRLNSSPAQVVLEDSVVKRIRLENRAFSAKYLPKGEEIPVYNSVDNLPTQALESIGPAVEFGFASGKNATFVILRESLRKLASDRRLNLSIGQVRALEELLLR